MRLRFLGTGTSFGVPVIGCGCETCRSADPRDRRTRHAVLLEEGDSRILVDTPPELRLQLVAAGIDQIDAVWYTHHHADHTHGVDDLRAFTLLTGEPVQVYASRECADALAETFRYVFDPSLEPLDGTSKPEGELHILRPYEPVEIAGMRLTPLPVPHGPVHPYGFRVGSLGYITDAKALPPRTLDALRGVRTLVLNALWFTLPHPTHFTVEEAVEVAREVGAEVTYLTHISHLASHAMLEERLPANIRPSYDGLILDL